MITVYKRRFWWTERDGTRNEIECEGWTREEAWQRALTYAKQSGWTVPIWWQWWRWGDVPRSELMERQ